MLFSNLLLWQENPIQRKLRRLTPRKRNNRIPMLRKRISSSHLRWYGCRRSPVGVQKRRQRSRRMVQRVKKENTLQIVPEMHLIRKRLHQTKNNQRERRVRRGIHQRRRLMLKRRKWFQRVKRHMLRQKHKSSNSLHRFRLNHYIRCLCLKIQLFYHNHLPQIHSTIWQL